MQWWDIFKGKLGSGDKITVPPARIKLREGADHVYSTPISSTVKL